jgi:hypothetical protein
VKVLRIPRCTANCFGKLGLGRGKALYCEILAKNSVGRCARDSVKRVLRMRDKQFKI